MFKSTLLDQNTNFTVDEQWVTFRRTLPVRQRMANKPTHNGTKFLDFI